MGYRSDVGIALGFKSKGACDAFIVAYKLKAPEFWHDMVVGNWDRVDDRVLVGCYDWMKWHPVFDEVKGVLDMIDWAVESCDATYRFVRVGEAVDDIEAIEEDDNADENTPMLCDYVDVHRSVATEAGEPLD